MHRIESKQGESIPHKLHENLGHAKADRVVKLFKAPLTNSRCRDQRRSCATVHFLSLPSTNQAVFNSFRLVLDEALVLTLPIPWERLPYT